MRGDLDSDQLAAYADRLRTILAEQSEALRRRLSAELLVPLGKQLLSPGPNWGQDGYFAGLPLDAVAHIVGSRIGRDAGFPIPMDCGFWYNTEFDSRDGIAFRFFFRRAWLHRAPEAPFRAVRLLLPHVVTPEVESNLSLSVDGASAVLRSVERDEHGRRMMTFAVLDEVVPLGRAVRLDFECSEVKIPALVRPGSRDMRRLSAAIAEPVFLASDR